ncbi:hypothetical protein BT96DRAFT_1025768 [Gymnopus androsaceus JB14]|uniref:Uncharacterized protein n=1 Tax=Gymnopus androsaceus JB14 TaxID=1447944 RepID=A0A6A4GQZ7_9AGAR|nr:hypothetical protein BT96DRAFT_1025768 [Gymnopus androsaceus JB14]
MTSSLELARRDLLSRLLMQTNVSKLNSQFILEFELAQYKHLMTPEVADTDKDIVKENSGRYCLELCSGKDEDSRSGNGIRQSNLQTHDSGLRFRLQNTTYPRCFVQEWSPEDTKSIDVDPPPPEPLLREQALVVRAGHPSTRMLFLISAEGLPSASHRPAYESDNNLEADICVSVLRSSISHHSYNPETFHHFQGRLILSVSPGSADNTLDRIETALAFPVPVNLLSIPTTLSTGLKLHFSPARILDTSSFAIRIPSPAASSAGKSLSENSFVLVDDNSSFVDADLLANRSDSLLSLCDFFIGYKTFYARRSDLHPDKGGSSRRDSSRFTLCCFRTVILWPSR